MVKTTFPTLKKFLYTDTLPRYNTPICLTFGSVRMSVEKHFSVESKMNKFKKDWTLQ